MDLTPHAKRAFSLQSYTPPPAIDGVHVVNLVRHADDGGSMTELGRLAEGRLEALPDFTVRQVNYSELEPGTLKAFHVHVRQTDVWYVPPSDRMLVVLLDVRQRSSTEGVHMRVVLGNGVPRLLVIPPGVAHGVRNLAPSPGRIIYFADVPFAAEPSACDEGRLPWDFGGTDVWEITRG